MAAVDRDRRRGRSSLLKAVTLTVIVAVAGLVAWALVGDGRWGGEPVVVVAIPEAPSEAAATAGLAMRASVEPDDPALGPEIAATSPDAGILDPSRAIADAPPGASAPIRLAHAPVDGLIDSGEFGPLPRIAADGRTPAEVYARPAPPVADGPGAPARVAVLVGGLGISASGTAEAIERLPEEATLAFAPYGSGLQAWVDRARSTGHEVMLQVPMEPFDFPDNDPGPHTLLTSLEPGENLTRLHWLLARFTGYFGVTNYMGAKFTATPGALSPIVSELAGRGLAIVDDGSSPRSQTVELAAGLGMGAYRADVTIAPGQPREGIEEALLRLEVIAKERGNALATATALPIVIETLAEWSADLDRRGIALVPVSALVSGGAT